MNVARIATWTTVSVLTLGALYSGLRTQPILVESAAIVRQEMVVAIDEEGQTREWDHPKLRPAKST